LDQLVFSDKEISSYINQRFISLKVDGEKGQGPELMKMFGVPGYPTVILLDHQGNEIDRIVGFGGNKDEYLSIIKNYSEGENTLRDYLSRLRNDSDNIELIHIIAQKYLYREETIKAKTYYEKIVTLDIKDEFGYKNEAMYQIAQYELHEIKNVGSMRDFISNATDDKYIKRAYSGLARYYRKINDFENMVKAYEESIERYDLDASLLNSYAWEIFRLKLKDKYKKGIEVAEKAVSIEPEADAIWDTLGQLQFEAGDVQEAIKAMQKAVQLNPEEESYKNNLETYKQALENT
jgi:tetratricopeptide (TPR) repeat protein